MSGAIFNILRENRAFLFFLLLMFLFRGAIADWNEVPTGSMQPTIVEGDRIWVDKLAYDLRIPLTHISLYRFSEPMRGDIVVFDSAASGKTMVKRVIGIPGDRVELKNNRLYLNEEAANYELKDGQGERKLLVEQSMVGRYIIAIHPNSPSPRSSFNEVFVPDGYYLVMGDNRDNSADSRYYGLVPRDEVIGRSDQVIVSLDYDDFYLPRKSRWFIDLI